MSQGRLFRLIYASRITPAVDAALEPELDRILAVSVRNNHRASVSGMLVAHRGWFFQALEGPERAVEGRFDVIRRDHRHTEARVLSWDPASRRLFGRWAMCGRPLHPTDRAILQVLDGRPEFAFSGAAAAEVQGLLQAVAGVHARALSAQRPDAEPGFLSFNHPSDSARQPPDVTFPRG